MSRKDSSPRIFQNEKLKEKLTIREFEWSENQKNVIDTILSKDSKLIFIDGKAGTGKTLLGIYCGLRLLNEKKLSNIIYIRSVIESASRSLGFLPGEASEKFQPFLMPLEDKLKELLYQSEVDKLFKEQRINPIAINFLRGCSFAVKYILSDESQNLTLGEQITLVSRIGQFSKCVILGDSFQSDINGKSGFKKMFDIFNNEASRKNGIFCFKLGNEDIRRSGVLRFILETIENAKESKLI